jgi:hypothetical protein
MQTATVDVIATLPVLAAGFAVPQFVPQIAKLRRTDDTAGLSPSWALLTGINNAAWFGYFASSRYWLALIPASSAALLGGYLGLSLSRRPGALRRQTWTLVGVWALLLTAAAAVDRRLLGALLTAAFLVQIVPAVSTAYRTRLPTGIARGTWLLVLAETSCWALFGTAKSDIPLVVLGATGVISALLMLNRARSISPSTGRPAAVRRRQAGPAERLGRTDSATVSIRGEQVLDSSGAVADRGEEQTETPRSVRVGGVDRGPADDRIDLDARPASSARGTRRHPAPAARHAPPAA